MVQSSAAIAEARRLTHLPSLAACLALGTRLLSLDGDNATLHDRAEQLMEVATEQGFPYGVRREPFTAGTSKSGIVMSPKAYRLCGAV